MGLGPGKSTPPPESPSESTIWINAALGHSMGYVRRLARGPCSPQDPARPDSPTSAVPPPSLDQWLRLLRRCPPPPAADWGRGVVELLRVAADVLQAHPGPFPQESQCDEALPRTAGVTLAVGQPRLFLGCLSTKADFPLFLIDDFSLLATI